MYHVHDYLRQLGEFDQLQGVDLFKESKEHEERWKARNKCPRKDLYRDPSTGVTKA